MIPSVLVRWIATPDQRLDRALTFGEGSKYASAEQAVRLDALYHPEKVATLLSVAEMGEDGIPYVAIGHVDDEELVSWDGRAVKHPSWAAIEAALGELTPKQIARREMWLVRIQAAIQAHEETAARQVEERKVHPQPADSAEAFAAAPLPAIVTYADGSREVVDPARADELAALMREASRGA